MVTDFKITYCSFSAAKYACVNWHYSKAMPTGKLVKIGVWEENKFIGCIIFGWGANNNLCKAYDLPQTQVCELCRIALKEHKNPVSLYLSKALVLLKKCSPDLKVVVSFADMNEGHVGIVYQAANWAYTGTAKSTPKYFFKGRWIHNRQLYSRGFKTSSGFKTKEQVSKRRYEYYLDKAARKKFITRALKYPACDNSITANAVSDQLTEGGQHYLIAQKTL